MPREITELGQRLHDAVRDCVIVDCETTGLDPDSDRIIEVAAVLVRDGVITDSLHTLVNPGVPLPRVVSGLTGLSDGDLADQPPTTDVLAEILSFMEGHRVVGHNVSFDIAFLKSEVHRSAAVAAENTDTAHTAHTAHTADLVIDARTVLSDAPESSLCTAASARTLIPREQVGRFKLDTLAESLGLAHTPSHRAADDVLATADLLAYLDRLAS